MYVLAVLSMVKIYQARHPDINARAHATFAVLAVLIALGTTPAPAPAPEDATSTFTCERFCFYSISCFLQKKVENYYRFL